MQTTDYTYEEFEFEGNMLSLELEVEFSVAPYVPAVMYLRNGDPGYPAEGGYCEDLIPTVKSATIYDEEGNDRQATAEELVRIDKAFGDYFDNNESLQDRLNSHCYDAASDYCGDCDD